MACRPTAHQASGARPARAAHTCRHRRVHPRRHAPPIVCRGGLMFLTAHRVTSPSSGRSGINAFYYRHGDEVAVDWTNPDPVAIGETEPGILVGDAIEVAPGGNLVRSYLDVVAHDATPVAAVEKALAGCRARPPTGVPMVVRGSVGVRFGVELGLEEDARGPEFEDLRDRALGLL